MEILEAKPPFVRFEVRAVEDRQATIANGHYTSKDVNFALITPSGSHDCVEKPAENWLGHIERESMDGRFPGPWVDYYKRAYDNFCKGLDVPLSGTPLTDWPGLSPAQLKNLQGINIRTVEDLANANEEALHHIGMGARALKTRAASFLLTSEDVGKVAEELAQLKESNRQLQLANEAMEKRLAALEPNTKQPVAAKAKVDPLDDIIKE